MRLARLESIGLQDAVPDSSAQIGLGETIVSLPLSGGIDFSAEPARLGKELEKISKDIATIDGRLSNPSFVTKAPEEVLEETQDRKRDLEHRREKITEALQRLG